MLLEIKLQYKDCTVPSCHLSDLEFSFFCFWSMVVRPTMPETTALGAAMAAGMAKGVDVWTINPEDKSQINTDVFEPAIDPRGKINWNTVFSACVTG